MQKVDFFTAFYAESSIGNGLLLLINKCRIIILEKFYLETISYAC